jgi:hypothetical protein
MLVGRSPFQSNNEDELFRMIREDNVKFPARSVASSGILLQSSFSFFSPFHSFLLSLPICSLSQNVSRPAKHFIGALLTKVAISHP